VTAPALRRRGRPAKAEGELGRERILAAALETIDRGGVAALSLRELAKALGVTPTAIYWHVPSRNELVAGAVALALQGVAAGLARSAGASWQERLRTLFTRFRDALRRHPRLAPVVGGEMLSNSPLDLPMLEHIVDALEDAGFDGPALVDAFNVVVAALCGFVTLELAAAPAEEPQAWAALHRERLAAIPEAQFPALSRHLGRLRNKAFIVRWSGGEQRPMNAAFEAWVDVVLGGLAQRAQSLHLPAKGSADFKVP
jgi:AcrR family transcriptional regulator